jgi:hypothetical protein
VKYLDKITITLRNQCGNKMPVHVNVTHGNFSEKWLSALNHLIKNNYHLEKNYCFLGFADSDRNGQYILDQVNLSITKINQANIGYTIDDYFSLENTITNAPVDGRTSGRNLIHDKLNHLHKYFEDLQGSSDNLSEFYVKADAETQWHIRQLNLLCHEFESWALSYRKQIEAPEWQRPSQLMCWLNAPRFNLTSDDYDLFGVETLNRSLGGVYVGVNKGVGKHHWEVFVDEANYNPAHRADNLTTSALRPQIEAAGDFDIEWGRNPGEFEWQKKHLQDFQCWLVNNGFDPEDKSLTIGHPKVAQINLIKSFGTTDYRAIWRQLNNFQDVYSIKTSDASAVYDYRWSDTDFQQRQIDIISQGQ